MTTFKNLEHIEYQVFEEKTRLNVPKDHIPVIFFFKNKDTNEIGIETPDFSQRCVETFSMRFVETMILNIFDDNAKAYFCDKQQYVQTALTKKELANIKAELKNSFAKEKEIIGNLNNVIFVLHEKTNEPITCEIKEIVNLSIESIEESVRFNEYRFLLGLCGFVYEYNQFVCHDKSEDLESIKNMLKRFGCYVNIHQVVNKESVDA